LELRDFFESGGAKPFVLFHLFTMPRRFTFLEPQSSNAKVGQRDLSPSLSLSLKNLISGASGRTGIFSGLKAPAALQASVRRMTGMNGMRGGKADDLLSAMEPCRSSASPRLEAPAQISRGAGLPATTSTAISRPPRINHFAASSFSTGGIPQKSTSRPAGVGHSEAAARHHRFGVSFRPALIPLDRAGNPAPTRVGRGSAAGRFASLVLLLTTPILGLVTAARAQDWVRNHFEQPSVTPGGGGLTAASPGLNPVSTRVGRTANFAGLAIDASAVGSMEYNDNVRLEPNGQSGLIARGALRLDGFYQFTRLQNIALTSEVSDRVPLSGPGRHEHLLAVSPDSALRFNVWVKSLRLSPFLKFSRQLDPALSPVVNGTETYSVSAFTAGVQADLPLHRSGLQLLVLEEWRRQYYDAGPVQSSLSRVVSLRSSRELSATNMLAADVAVTRTGLSNGPAARSGTISAGLSDIWLLSAATTVRFGAGLERRVFHESRTPGDIAKRVTPFFSLNANHRLRDNLAVGLSFNRTVTEGVSTNFYRTSELTFTPQYNFTRALAVDFSSSWQWIGESGPKGETATRQRHGGSLSYQLRPDLGLRAGAYRAAKRSNLASRRYTQNLATISASFQF
jgi:hypothetical protein